MMDSIKVRRSAVGGNSADSENTRLTKSDLRTEKLRDRLLEAASQFFMEKGFEATSMAEIARSSRSSKETFYRYFPTKEELFRAVISRRAKRLASEVVTALVADELPEKALAAFGNLVLSRLATLDTLALHRILVMERERLPDLAGALHTQGPALISAAVSRYLNEQVSKGTLRRLNSGVAARQFFDLLAADMMRSIMLGHAIPTKAQIRRRVKEAVSCFLHGYSS